MRNVGLEEILQENWGFSAFRSGQREMIERVLAGRNVLGIMATGGGKSITYQLPSLVLSGVTLVITPLISLMIDQVQQLRSRGRMDAAYINSSLTSDEMNRVLQDVAKGRYRLIYISPEKLSQPYVIQLLKRRGVSLCAVDEAHCISQWGHDFRTDYLRLPQIVNDLGKPPVLAVTATATQAVQEELCELFSIDVNDKIILSLDRSNIAYDLKKVETEQEKVKHLLEAIQRLGGPGIVYCSSRQSVEQLVSFCHQAGLTTVFGYHGGMNAMDRVLIQEQFLRGEISVIIATNAFGMGIDKSNIRYVLHYHFPASIEAYVQEVGRMGRDGGPGYACVYYDQNDWHIHNRLIQNEFPTAQEINSFFQLLSQTGKQQGRAELTIVELQAWLGVSEQTLRMLFYYAEKAGSIQQVNQTVRGYQFDWAVQPSARIATEIGSRLEAIKQAKVEKLRNMQQWLEGNSCLRYSLSNYFGGSETVQPEVCCANCGIDRSKFEFLEEADVKMDQEPWNLKSSLQKLFPGLLFDMEEAGIEVE
ncbi:RecQ family ATP-dependent DNA helicase [Brevibacillus sp. SYSU BS000544]|uniref:RecQ family ATP-dependent DNA helicase n=1 Tax=Brevibacillus sp. SYSU BS000544 TaxID=3416443 RepID=UPI003CE5014E